MKNTPLYIISIVSEMLDLHPQTLRQYERLGLVHPQRTQGNTRLYSEDDLQTLKFILTLTKDMGVNLAGVEVIMNMREQMAELQEQNNQLKEFIKQNAQHLQKAKEGLVPSSHTGIIKVKINEED
ncbi:transcriptional regulator, MerR family [Denitrovibrio acetiphilus DSM 12809]|uniref:Transcriptional regulator, MerR family n=1 Tax=Denitrovibrio acetiphilus (strain DSM 12809 / NBRC 114555 / N2460) TaxID=522772 RepID=D4H8X4_DENA2|nr:helix-turn-helix transcriptional regulator [Denitrovibrio acetiphilus]ADD68473.1 transcriptional regulator, MerR family [Denitrovibrio acetiphilus DSM 12809]